MQRNSVMAKIEVMIHGKRYMVSCDDGKEAHLSALAKYIDKKMSELDNGRGQASEAQLLMMTSLQIADELASLYNDLDDLRRSELASDRMSGQIDAAAERIEALAAQLKRSA
ncbi:MAG: cell division protein ZapA [Alphaproteobacteria bacterium]